MLVQRIDSVTVCIIKINNRRMTKNIININSKTELEITHKHAPIKTRKVKSWTSEEDKLLLKLYEQYPKQWTQIASLIPDRNENQCLHRYRRLSQNGLIIHKIWSEEEDNLVKKFIKKVGKNWKALSEMLGTKTGKQIRERFINKLDPKIKRQEWTQEQDLEIIKLYKIIGSKWSQIAKNLPGRPQNMIKNRFYSYISKNYEFTQRTIIQTERSQLREKMRTTSLQHINIENPSQQPEDLEDENVIGKAASSKKFMTSIRNISSIQLINRQPLTLLNQNRDSGLEIKTYNHFSEVDYLIYLSNSLK